MSNARDIASLLTKEAVFNKRVSEEATSLTGTSIDWSIGGVYYKSISGATTLTDSNLPSSGQTQTIELELDWSTGTVTFPAAWDWGDAGVPALTAGKNRILATCRDGSNIEAVFIGGGF